MREEEKQKSVHPLKSKWFKKKRVIYPAVYLGFAAILLAAVLWYQSDVSQDAQPEQEPNDTPSAYDTENEDSTAVHSSQEVIQMPVADEGVVSVKTKFYDVEATAEEQQEAIVVYNNGFFQSTGIDLVAENNETFDVIASLSGEVVKAEKDPILGNVVVLEHENGVTTHYSSLKSLQVEVGDTVKQNAVLGQAGLSEFNKDAGVHAHFELRKDGVAVNPSEYVGQMVTAIATDTPVNAQEEDESQGVQEDAEESVEEDSSSDSADQTEEEPAEDTGNEDEATENDA